jgi:hypothetical protein
MPRIVTEANKTALGTRSLADGAWTDATKYCISTRLDGNQILKLYATMGAGILTVWAPGFVTLGREFGMVCTEFLEQS